MARRRSGQEEAAEEEEGRRERRRRRRKAFRGRGEQHRCWRRCPFGGRGAGAAVGWRRWRWWRRWRRRRRDDNNSVKDWRGAWSSKKKKFFSSFVFFLRRLFPFSLSLSSSHLESTLPYPLFRAPPRSHVLRCSCFSRYVRLRANALYHLAGERSRAAAPAAGSRRGWTELGAFLLSGNGREPGAARGRKRAQEQGGIEIALGGKAFQTPAIDPASSPRQAPPVAPPLVPFV